MHSTKPQGSGKHRLRNIVREIIGRRKKKKRSLLTIAMRQRLFFFLFIKSKCCLVRHNATLHSNGVSVEISINPTWHTLILIFNNRVSLSSLSELFHADFYFQLNICNRHCKFGFMGFITSFFFNIFLYCKCRNTGKYVKFKLFYFKGFCSKKLKFFSFFFISSINTFFFT